MAEIEVDIPLVAQVVKEKRGEDLRQLGGNINEWVDNIRTTWKERDTLKTERETLVKERDTLKAQPRFGPLAADAKPEDVVAYRKAHGVPDKPEGYQFKLPDGMPADVLGDTKAFYDLAHKHNVPQSVVQELLQYEVGRAVETRKAMADVQNAKAKELADKLNIKYGTPEAAQAKVNDAMKAVEAFGSPALRKRIEDKEHPDPIGNDGDVLEFCINVGAMVTERGLMPGGTGPASVGEVDYAKLYPASFSKGYMK